MPDSPQQLDGQIQWHCPFCDYTNQSQLDVRKHISETAVDIHKGRNGWSLTEDIVATNADEDIIKRIPGADLDDPPTSLEEESKKTLIINAWQARDGHADPQVLADILGCTTTYARDVLNDIEYGEIRAHERQEHLDQRLMNWLDDRILAYYYVDSADEPEPEPETELESESMTPTDTNEDQIEASDESGESDEPELPGSKKDRLAALKILGIADELTNKEAAEIAGTSEEYARQILNALSGKEGYDKADESDLKRVSGDEELTEVVAERAFELGLVDGHAIQQSEPTVSAEPSERTESTESSDTTADDQTRSTAATTPQPDATPDNTRAISAREQARELVAVMDALEREADVEGDDRRAFVAREAKTRAEDLVQLLD